MNANKVRITLKDGNIQFDVGGTSMLPQLVQGLKFEISADDTVGRLTFTVLTNDVEIDADQCEIDGTVHQQIMGPDILVVNGPATQAEYVADITRRLDRLTPQFRQRFLERLVSNPAGVRHASEMTQFCRDQQLADRTAVPESLAYATNMPDYVRQRILHTKVDTISLVKDDTVQQDAIDQLFPDGSATGSDDCYDGNMSASFIMASQAEQTRIPVPAEDKPAEPEPESSIDFFRSKMGF